MMKDKVYKCPLLADYLSYCPDTFDLISDVEAFSYWLPCLDNMTKTFVHKVARLSPDDVTAPDRARSCWQKFHDLVEDIKCDPHSFKSLSVRTLLEYNEEVLRSHEFDDVWLSQKEAETDIALDQFPERVWHIDKIGDFRAKWTELAKGLIAGNMFDWGAKAIADILEVSSNAFDLNQAMSTIQARPWFRDDLDSWIDQLQRRPYKKAIIFVDNAGVDFVLGILPMTRQLVKMGTEVVLVANTSPALNDVTLSDLQSYMRSVRCKCSVLDDAIDGGKMILLENGQKGPCLNLLDLPLELCSAMMNADLIILEGMGRAIHTNLRAKFAIDCLKLAVLKNEWVAKHLGAQQFSVIFQYEPVAGQ